MNKTVCIFPEDFTTEFLRPLCDFICATFDAVEVGYDTSGDNDPLEIIYNKLKDAKTIFFLGHGKSTCLYASITDNVELINKNNISLLDGKRLFLLACDSNQFVEKYNLTNAIGFGFLPTSLDDARSNRNFHHIHKEILTSEDVSIYKKNLVNIFTNSLSKETLKDLSLLKERIFFNTCMRIVDCLTNRECPNYKIVADELFYLNYDMLIN